MKKILLTSLIMAALASPVASARQLTPDEALHIYMEHDGGVKKTSASAFDLVYTEQSPETQTNGVYVFNRPAGSGFVLLAADDAIGNVMLGYSDESGFDKDNIPPGVQAMLRYYAYCVGRYSTMQITREAPVLPPRESVAALCKTKWNQDDPYNAECPEILGEKAVTGCVATAMAQIMKKYEWPAKGRGWNTYTFDYWSGWKKYTYTEYMDFSEVTFAWDKMLNNYSKFYTSTQAKAVATLMHSCGVAVNMMYSPDGSGAYDEDVAQAFVEYFDYDPGIQLLMRDYYNPEEWDEMVYNELAAGRPIYYGGYTENYYGHAFICDGYDSETGYYHINWGWGGYYNGYFSLTDLNPGGSGIGGSDDDGGYNFGNCMICGIQPPPHADTGIDLLTPEAVSSAGEDVEYYNLQGIRVFHPDRGVYIRRVRPKAAQGK